MHPSVVVFIVGRKDDPAAVVVRLTVARGSAIDLNPSCMERWSDTSTSSPIR
jgi:hypothetical protein